MIRSQVVSKAALALFPVILLGLSVALGAQTSTPTGSDIVVIRGGKTTIAVGEQVQFSAQKLGGMAYPAGQVVWRSLGQEIIAIDQNGVARGVKPGSTTILAAVGGANCTLDVTVVDSNTAPASGSTPPNPPASAPGLTIQGKRTIEVGEQASFSAMVNGSPGTNVSWLSADPGTLSIDPSGTAKGLKPGKAVVLATAGDLSDFMTVEVTNQPAPSASSQGAPNAASATRTAGFKDEAVGAGPAPAAIRPEAPAISSQAPTEIKPVLVWPTSSLQGQAPQAQAPQAQAPRAESQEEIYQRAFDTLVKQNAQANQQQKQAQKQQALQALLNVMGSMSAQKAGAAQPFPMSLPNQAPQTSGNAALGTYMNLFSYFLNQRKNANQQQAVPNFGNQVAPGQSNQIAQQLGNLLNMYQNMQQNPGAQAMGQNAQGQGAAQGNQVAQQLMSLLGNYQNMQQNAGGQPSLQNMPGQGISAQSNQFLEIFMGLMNNLQNIQNSTGNQKTAPLSTQPPAGFQIQPQQNNQWQQPSAAQPATPSAQPAIPSVEQVASAISALAAAAKPKDLLTAKTAFLSYQTGYERIITDLPKRLREWGHWLIVDNPDQADLLLFCSQGKLNLFSNEIVLQVFDRNQQNVATISCERRIRGTGSVLVNRLKKHIESLENQKPKKNSLE